MVAAKELIRSALIILVLLTQPLWALSGDSFLSRKISLNIPSCSLETALREIGKAGCFRFSYDADLIPAGRKVDLKAGTITPDKSGALQSRLDDTISLYQSASWLFRNGHLGAETDKP